MATGALIAAVVLIGAGAAISASAAIQAGKAAKAEAEFEAEVLRQQAERESIISRQAEEDFRLEGDRLIGERGALLGVSGVEGGSGSPLAGLGFLGSEIELQALRLRSGGKARELRLGEQANLALFRGKTEQKAARLRAGASLLTGGGQAFAAGA